MYTTIVNINKIIVKQLCGAGKGSSGCSYCYNPVLVATAVVVLQS